MKISILPLMLLTMPTLAMSEETGWNFGFYAAKYYDTEPANFWRSRTKYLEQYMVALNVSKTVWRSESESWTLEIDGMLGHQFGLHTLNEFAIAPTLGWHRFPWSETLPTTLRFAPLGYSHTSSVSRLEQGTQAKGSRTLNLLLAELSFASPASKSEEIFFRLHHRCDIYDILNQYGNNGEDFFAIGYRHQY